MQPIVYRMLFMRLAIILAVALSACGGSDEITVEEACAEQADAWCSIVDQCETWSWPSCVQERTRECLSEMSAPIETAAQDACLDILYATELTDSCEVESGAWWPAECQATRH